MLIGHDQNNIRPLVTGGVSIICHLIDPLPLNSLVRCLIQRAISTNLRHVYGRYVKSPGLLTWRSIDPEATSEPAAIRRRRHRSS